MHCNKFKLKWLNRKTCSTPTYITLKNHKENFRSNPSRRLINPSKTGLGRISKIILDRTNNELLSKLNYNQWKNTDNVINWFKNITDKKHCKFIQLDIKEFYPSITEETLNKALDFAEYQKKTSVWYITAENHYYFSTMKRGRKKIWTVLLM